MALNDVVIMAAYFAAILILNSKDSLIMFAATAIGILYSYSTLFEYSTPTQVHLFYIITLLLFGNFAKSWVVKYPILLMVALNILMIWDFYYYANVETWAYENFGVNASIIHAFIILSLFYGRRNIISNNLFYVRLRRMLASHLHYSNSRKLSGCGNIEKNKISEA